MAGFTACSNDFLDIKPEQNVADEDAITDVNTLKTAINGVYSRLQSSDYYGRSMYVIPELMADNLFLSSRNTGRYLDYDNFVVADEDTFAEGAWDVMYEVVVNATKAIVRGQEIESTSQAHQNQLNALIGEAYALRALAHFDLVRMFAQPYNYSENAAHLGIAVIKTVSADEIKPARSSVKEVYDHINDDLNQAIAFLPNSNNNGHFNATAAKALAARVALYQEDYDRAIALSTEVINNGNQLISNSNYFDIWDQEFNSESLFEIVNTIADNPGTNSLGHYFDVNGYADALVAEDLINAFDANDIRLEAILEGSKPGAEELAFFVGKFPKGTSHDDNIRILRLSEQYLIRAEAYVNVNEEELAQEDILTIAQRANPSVTEITETGAALIDRILLERRKELAFEGHRLFDLNRNKRSVTIIQGDQSIQAEYPNDKFILPIPLSELNANTNMVPNPGY